MMIIIIIIIIVTITTTTTTVTMRITEQLLIIKITDISPSSMRSKMYMTITIMSAT